VIPVKWKVVWNVFVSLVPVLAVTVKRIDYLIHLASYLIYSL